ncbi:FtsX-like permease family protein [Yinghuangia sp. ASG 101]|uniref:ABC transporter permease n=1 Tax=Yinghuangia sp. ASG 101 TaxID=2896848 RepID=UPI001E63C44B|nr:FtsX-like permease family protein [Yinghuangia sp. ASG 101]UGQ08953.1 FtsX-like permease family protein [Yinghuangia sp. ASG 101]
MKAVVGAAWAAVVRRRLQTFVTAVVVLLACATSVLALGLLTASLAPFDHAFAELRGAHATVSVDATKATEDQVRATADRPGVIAVGGPYPSATAVPTLSGGRAAPTAVTVVGRADPDGPVDALRLAAGRWVRAPGEVVMAASGLVPGTAVGDRVRFGDVELTVVGVASSVTETAAAWTLPEQIAALRPTGNCCGAASDSACCGAAPDSACCVAATDSACCGAATDSAAAAAAAVPTFQVLYRFADAGDDTAVSTGVAEVRAGLPEGAVLGSTSYLRARHEAAGVASLVVPFVTASGVLGIVMSVLIVGNVVSGAVVAGYRGIGVLKALGFTPAQVCAVYIAHVLFPALIGAALGTVVGHLLSIPLLADTADSYAVPEVAAIPWWVDVAVPLGLAVVVCAAALVPALRAARIPAVQAIAVGRAPRGGRGFRVHRLLARTRLPRAVSLGLASPFAKPGRTAMTFAALLLGTAAVTFAYGLRGTLDRADDGLSRNGSSQVTVALRMPQAPPEGPLPPPAPADRGGPSADPEAVAAVLRADPGTARFTPVTRLSVQVPGRTQPVELTAYDTDSSWLGYPVLAGRWFEGGGEAVVPTVFLRSAALELGDEITVESDGRRATVRIVGEIFSNEENSILTDRGTAAALSPGAPIVEYEVRVADGTSAGAYAARISENPVFDAGVGAAQTRDASNGTITVLLGLIGLLTVLLAVVAALGVLNTVALDTRERAQAIGVLKSLGMTPRQTMAMVVTSVVALGLVGGAVGIPLGVALHHLVAPVMADTADLRLTDPMVAVYGIPAYAALAASGAVPAALGAALPAAWAARTRAAAWRTE